MRTTLRTSSLISLALSTQNREAALLRATTDLFVHGGHHTPDEIQRFEELAIHFLPKVLVSDRAYVAESLSGRADAPPAVLRHLAKDLIEVATPILKRARVLSADDFLEIIETTGPLHHRMLATRKTLPPEVEQALRDRQDAVTVALLDGPVATTKASRPDAEAESGAKVTAAEVTEKRFAANEDVWAEETPTEAAEAEDEKSTDLPLLVDLQDVADRFLNLDGDSRKDVLAALSHGQVKPPKLTPRQQFDIALNAAQKAGQIPGLARSKRKEALVAAFADGLSLDLDLVERMIDDPSGEPLVLLVKAIGLSDAEARQVLLLANPAIGAAVQTFFRLVDLHAAMEPTVAEAMVGAWRENSGEAAQKQHVPQFSEAEGVRRAAARTRRQASQREKDFLRKRGA